MKGRTTHSAASGQSPSGLLILDVTSRGLLVDWCEGSADEISQIVQSLQLHLPFSTRGLQISSRTKTLGGDPRESAREILDETNLDNTTIVFGFTSDPFFPFEGKFDIALGILELLAARPPRQLIVQTRSPLVVIALPLLKRLGDRASITVAFEALDDHMSLRLSPKLPRPSERIKTARALRRFGVSVITQVAPLSTARREKEQTQAYAEVLDEISSGIRFVSLESVGWTPTQEMSVKGTARSMNYEEELWGALTKIAPEKLIAAEALDRKSLYASLAA